MVEGEKTVKVLEGGEQVVGDPGEPGRENRVEGRFYPVRERPLVRHYPRFEKAAKRTYEPRVTFQIKRLSPEQMNNLRTVLFILRLLEARVRAEGSIRKAAKAMGVSKSYLGDVLKGRKPPGYHLSRMVGYVPKTLYLRVWEEHEVPEHLTGPKAGVQNRAT